VPFGDHPPRALSARAYWKAELRYDDPGWLRRLDAVIPREVVPLPGGDESRTALYLGAMDERGEYPLLVFDIDDVPSVYFEAGFDVWLARHFSLPGFDPPELPARVAQEAFGGRTSLTAQYQRRSADLNTPLWGHALPTCSDRARASGV
jgi:hypothetical protein